MKNIYEIKVIDKIENDNNSIESKNNFFLNNNKLKKNSLHEMKLFHHLYPTNQKKMNINDLIKLYNNKEQKLFLIKKMNKRNKLTPFQKYLSELDKKSKLREKIIVHNNSIKNFNYYIKSSSLNNSIHKKKVFPFLKTNISSEYNRTSNYNSINNDNRNRKNVLKLKNLKENNLNNNKINFNSNFLNTNNLFILNKKLKKILKNNNKKSIEKKMDNENNFWTNYNSCDFNTLNYNNYFNYTNNNRNKTINVKKSNDIINNSYNFKQIF